MPGSHRTLPPLPEAVHVRIVQRHLGVEPADRPALGAQPKAHLRLLTSDDRRVVAPHVCECLGPKERVAAAGLRGADGRVPLHVGQRVVDAGFGKALTPSAADNRESFIGFERRPCRLNPIGPNLAITIDELNEPEAGQDFPEPCKPLVAGAGRGEGHRKIKLDDLHAQRTRKVATVVRRTRIHIHHTIRAADERSQTRA